MNRRLIFLLTVTAIFYFFISLSGCSLFILKDSLTPDEYLPEAVLIVVDSEVARETEARIAVYQSDLSAEGVSSSVIVWENSDNYAELKDRLIASSADHTCAFFVGNLPVAWYEQEAFGEEEVFPADLYYMDLDSIWSDTDGDGYLDEHSDIEVDFYISRITGSAEELNFYFDKLSAYRSGTGFIYDDALIFKDDDWQSNYRSNSLGLDSLYSSVTILQDPETTLRESYIEQVTGNGYEFVYQWVHAAPPVLFFDEGDTYDLMRASDIGANNLKANFYNLFDCQAARFTVNNLASNYLLETDSAISVVGSTKTGGIYYPIEFNKALGEGACWGAAYRVWYNNSGYTDDNWFLGMIIMGDPAIRPYHASGADIAEGSRSISTIIPLSEEETDRMFLQLRDFDLAEEYEDKSVDE